MNKSPFFTDQPYNVRCEFGLQTSICSLYSVKNSVKIVEMRGDYLLLGVHAHVFCCAV